MSFRYPNIGNLLQVKPLRPQTIIISTSTYRKDKDSELVPTEDQEDEDEVQEQIKEEVLEEIEKPQFNRLKTKKLINKSRFVF